MANEPRPDPRRAFYDGHLPFVLQVARAMLRDEDDVREVVQNVFLEVLQDAPAGVRDTRQWMRQVTRNHCNRLWRQRYRSADLRERLVGWFGKAPRASGDDPARTLDQRRMRDAFLRAFHALDDEEQTVIQMRHLDPELSRESPDDERTLDEIAAALQWNKIRVRRRLDSARKKLSAWLDLDARAVEGE